MIIYPAIDVRGGRVVRLKEGDPNRQTVFNDDPVATARAWIEQDAQWIHVVNLDGAFASANDNGSILEAIARLGVPVQFGGGLRSLADIERALAQGAARVMPGTLAVQQAELMSEAITRWGAERVGVALDARDGKVAIHGWQESSDLTPAELGRQMAGRGVRHALYTDVSRDGKLQGVNIDGTVKLAEETGLQVIASGGVSTVEEIRLLKASRVVAGVVIGIALYEGWISLREALDAAEGEDAG